MRMCVKDRPHEFPHWCSVLNKSITRYLYRIYPDCTICGPDQPCITLGDGNANIPISTSIRGLKKTAPSSSYLVVL